MRFKDFIIQFTIVVPEKPNFGKEIIRLISRKIAS